MKNLTVMTVVVFSVLFQGCEQYLELTQVIHNDSSAFLEVKIKTKDIYFLQSVDDAAYLKDDVLQFDSINYQYMLTLLIPPFGSDTIVSLSRIGTISETSSCIYHDTIYVSNFVMKKNLMDENNWQRNFESTAETGRHSGHLRCSFHIADDDIKP